MNSVKQLAKLLGITQRKAAAMLRAGNKDGLSTDYMIGCAKSAKRANVRRNELYAQKQA